MKKVLIIVPVKDEPMTECVKALEMQDYFNYEILMNHREPTHISENKLINSVMNDMLSRNELREKALKYDAEYFWMVDDDVVPPQKALTNLMLQMGEKSTTIDFPMPNGTIIPKGTKNPEKFIIGGWYPVRYSNNHLWVCGNWIADNIFCLLEKPEPSLIRVDVIGLGCCLVKREVLEKVVMTEKECLKTLKNKFGEDIIGGVCEAFCNIANNFKYRIYADGSVICEHLKRGVLV